MPFANFHSFRIIAPAEVTAYRDKKDGGGPGIDFIYGVLKSGKVEIASIRFDAEHFSYEQAKEWVKKHNFTPIESVPATADHAAMSKIAIEHLQIAFAAGPIDRANGLIRGMLVAEKGPFRNADRGEFNDAAVSKIADLINSNPDGIMSHLHHPGPSGTYPVGSYLGRKKNAVVSPDGKVRADLQFNKVAMEPGINGGKPLAHYIMDLAESDPKAIGSSLVLRTEKQFRKGQAPLWSPLEIHGSDIVDCGEATRSLLEHEPGIEAIDEEKLAAIKAKYGSLRRWLLTEKLRLLRKF